MKTRIHDALKRLSPWHFIWISIVCSELITLFLSVTQGRIWWNGVSRETLIIGAVDSLVVPLIVATGAIYAVKRITELQQNNERLQEANRKLQAVDRMKTDFLSSVSHELRTPLATVKSFVELIIMKPEMSEKRRAKLISTINVETGRLTRMLDSLLDLARIESGAVTWRFEEVCLGDIIRHVAATLEPLVESKGHCLTTSFCSPRIPISGDRDRLVQVVTNLLSNAVKYTPAGGAIDIAVRRQAAPGDLVVVEVSDTGEGIPARELDLIFEKFQRSGEQLAGPIEGTGLGLAIARQIVEFHGGRIWASSAPGKGSLFTFTLPPGAGGGNPEGIAPGQHQSVRNGVQ